ncbi:WecB/TagA/CpsF family glycosyltransferase [Salibaculum griseiflavum]|uniref:N-acetylglucosaminyldiphosphoundecaprenol N-acetyl-beta-D-mannosaminyltransferase n=1 Tax=Salibaculum griseiflavum TaxID=1914409 RepID=A0A2V1P116_9RHOB|nr:WecB/TagA/CpsF family glycosyltransferase [Salibaculum griseiflavum]PWG16155.1 hypothetical protein DFK10_13260 [Salibaculum griseiflavum]
MKNLDIIRSNLQEILNRNKLIRSRSDFFEKIEAGGYSVSYINPFVLSFPGLKDLAKLDRHFFVVDSLFSKKVLDVVYSSAGALEKIEVLNFDFSGVALDVFEFGRNGDWDFVFCGGTDSDVRTFTSVIEERFPGISVSGAFSGYDARFYKVKLKEFLRDRNAFVLLGLGSPKQEKEILEIHRGFGGSSSLACSIVTCGGFISQTAKAEDGNYYPAVVVRYNVRFLYRFFKEPKTIFRVIVHYPVFVVAVFQIRFCKKFFCHFL